MNVTIWYNTEITGGLVDDNPTLSTTAPTTSAPTRTPVLTPNAPTEPEQATDADPLERSQLSSDDEGLSVGAAVLMGLGGAAILLSAGYFAMRK